MPSTFLPPPTKYSAIHYSPTIFAFSRFSLPYITPSPLFTHYICLFSFSSPYIRSSPTIHNSYHLLNLLCFSLPFISTPHPLNSLFFTYGLVYFPSPPTAYQSFLQASLRPTQQRQVLPHSPYPVQNSPSPPCFPNRLISQAYVYIYEYHPHVFLYRYAFNLPRFPSTIEPVLKIVPLLISLSHTRSTSHLFLHTLVPRLHLPPFLSTCPVIISLPWIVPSHASLTS